MPSPQAQAATTLHRRELGRLSAAVAARVNRVAMSADVVDVDEWWRRTAAPQTARIVTQGHDVAAALSRRYLAGHAAMEGVSLRPIAVSANAQEITTSLHVTGPVAFKTNLRISEDPATARRVMGSMLQGSAQRLTLNGDRATIMRTFRESEEIVGWRRVGGGCAFCSMLISRGAVYSKRTVDFPAHDRCRCSAEPLYEHEPEPEQVRQLQEQWAEATRGAPDKDALRAWRDYLAEARPVRTPPTQIPASIAPPLPAVPVPPVPTAPAATPAAAAAPSAPAMNQVAAATPDDVLAALMPTRGGWTTKTRAQTVEALKRTPEGKQLLKTIDSFQSGGATAIPRLRTDVEKFLAGSTDLPEGRQDTIRTLLSAIKSSTHPDDTKSLWRGMSIPGSVEDVVARYQPGNTLDLSISSFSSDKKLAQGFTTKGAGQRVKGATQTPVLVEWVGPQKHALPIERLGKSRVFAEEREWVAAGRYEVDGVRQAKMNGVETVVVTMRQIGVW